jgi:hypothetical protein
MNYYYYRECQPERAIQGNFASGQINYKFNVNGNESYNPSKSYIKIRMKITKGDGSRLDKDFGVAPNMCVCDNLFQQIQIYCNGTCLSRRNDYIAQCSALEMRLNKSMTERNALLSSTNYSQIYLDQRLNDVSIDGNSEVYHYNEGAYLAKTTGDTFAGTNLDVGTDSLQYVAATKTFVWDDNADADLDMTNNFNPGDRIKITATVNVTQQVFTIVTVTNLTIVVKERFKGDVAANVANNGLFDIRLITNFRELQTVNQANDLDLIWKVPIGFFNIDDYVCGEYKLELTPHAESVWRKYAVEAYTNVEDLAPGAAPDATKFNVEISSLIMYLWTHVSPTEMSGSKSFTFDDIICSSQNLTTNNLTSKLFNVHSKNHSLTLAYQSSDAGDDITKSRSKFVIDNHLEQNLVRWYLIRNGVTLPDPHPRIQVDQAGGINDIVQRYYESLMYMDQNKNGITKYETVKEWLDAGLFFHYRWGTNSNKVNGNQVQVYSNFNTAFGNNPQVLLFDHYSVTMSMSMQSGRVTNVSVN